MKSSARAGAKGLLPSASSLLCVVVLSGSAIAGGGEQRSVEDARIERLAAGLDAVIAPDAEVEVLARGFQWTEGPLWVESGDMLLFSDVPANTVYAWREGQGVSEFLRPSGYTGTAPRGGEPGANGLALDADGKLLLCQHGDRRVARMSTALARPSPGYETVAATWGGRRFNSPNDLAVDSGGNIYFTDPPYGLERGEDDPAREMAVFGVYRIEPDGTVALLVDDLTRPNGIALSPDERTLYVANSDPDHAVWMSYRVSPDGSLSDGSVFHDATPLVDSRPGLPDGLKVDDEGNLFATGPGGVFVFTPAAELLGIIATGVPTANVALDTDESTLYITANDSLLRVRLR